MTFRRTGMQFGAGDRAVAGSCLTVVPGRHGPGCTGERSDPAFLLPDTLGFLTRLGLLQWFFQPLLIPIPINTGLFVLLNVKEEDNP
jgi:hypothetical protein